MACTYSSESGIEIVRQVNSIKPPDLKKIESTLRNCSQLLNKFLPSLSVPTVTESSNSFSVNLDKENNIDILYHKTKCRQLLLKREHWQLKSEISEKTYFENNYGPKRMKNTPNYLFKPILINTKQPAQQLSFARGFKTIRSDPDVRDSVFGKKSQIVQDAYNGFQNLKLGENKK